MENTEADNMISLDKALEKLKERPNTSVRTRLRGMDVEIRIAPKKSPQKGLGDLLASLGPWAGETAEEMARFIENTREQGICEDPPNL